MTNRLLLPVSLLLFAGSIYGAACGNSNENQPNSKIRDTIPAVVRDTSIQLEETFSGLFFDSTQLENYIQTNKVTDSVGRYMRDFYNTRNFQFAWFGKSGLLEQANSFMNLQRNSLGYVGDSSIYNKDLFQLQDSLQQGDSLTNLPDSTRLNVELQLTHEFFKYASRVYGGDLNINPANVKWFIPRRKLDLLSMLDSLVTNPSENIERFEPVNRQYHLLRNFLSRYDSLKHFAGWEAISASRKKYSTGDSSADLIPIKKRLFVSGDLSVADTTNRFDDSLKAAVINFQERYGLKADGVLGGETLREITKPVDQRIRQILINMERLRWVPDNPTIDYILVNIPEYRLHVYDKGDYQFNMNVVVGSSQNHTVIFTDKLKHVVFSPYWNVPPSIIKKEIEPGMKRDPNYLKKHNMEWNGGNVRQKPGPSNSLGLVKFLFPNNFNIYLHDTPSKSLFSESKRAFSHGCIRVSDPKKLAAWILRSDSNWTNDRITKAMNAGKEQWVPVKNDIVVYIGYFTAFVDRKGRLNFRNDIYGHDAEMEKLLFSGIAGY